MHGYLHKKKPQAIDLLGVILFGGEGVRFASVSCGLTESSKPNDKATFRIDC
jgi:hypothetical protein